METRLLPSLIFVPAVAALLGACTDGGQTYDDGTGGLGTARSEPTAHPTPKPSTTPDSTAAGDAGSLTCEQRRLEAANSFGDAVERADRNCASVDDCVEIFAPADCLNGCGTHDIFSTSGAADLSELTDRLCEPINASHCEQGPLPCDPPSGPSVPACVDGTCQYVDGPSDPSPTVDPNSSTCEQQQAAVITAFDSAAADADRSCTTVSDCVAVESPPGCVSPCNARSLFSVDAEPALTALGDQLCEPVIANDCQVVPAGCPRGPESETPACVDGMCQYLGSSDPTVGGTTPNAGGADGGTPNCYGPDQNLDQAYSGTLDGCPCEDAGDLCSQGVALICEHVVGEATGRWFAVEDGPCEPMLGSDQNPQACEGLFTSAQTCVEYFDLCIGDATRGICGTRRRTEQCPEGQLSDIACQSAECVDLDAGLFCSPLDPDAGAAR